MAPLPRGQFVVTSSGTATITDAPSILVGTSGIGDLDIGQTGATLGATANGNGSLTILRTPVVDVHDDMDIGQAGGTAQATGHGSLNVGHVDSFHVGGAMNVGTTGSASGVQHGNGVINLSFVDSLDIGGNLALGRTVTTGGSDTGNGSAQLATWARRCCWCIACRICRQRWRRKCCEHGDIAH